MNTSINFLFSQNRKITIQDSITNEKISYCSVDFLNGEGSFSNEKGEVEIPFLIEDVKISSLGYKTRNIKLSKNTFVINLLQEILELKEVVLKNNFKKVKHIYKMEEHKNFTLSFMPSFSREIAFYLPHKGNSYIKSISIPIFKNGHPANGNKRSNFKNILKIEILECKDSMPGIHLNNYKDTFYISSDSIKNKIEYEFKDEIIIPKEGLFVSITFLGQYDNKKNLIFELPYYIKDFNGNKIKVGKNLEPFFPIFRTNKSKTFTRVFFLNNKWESISQSSIRLINDNSQSKYNINIGYELIEKVYY
jgi:hypothetical protein